MNEPLYGTQNAHCTPLGPLSAPLHRATTVAQPDAETVRLLGTGQRKGEFISALATQTAGSLRALLLRAKVRMVRLRLAAGWRR